VAQEKEWQKKGWLTKFDNYRPEWQTDVNVRGEKKIRDER
jgi:hypothetical protein